MARTKAIAKPVKKPVKATKKIVKKAVKVTVTKAKPKAKELPKPKKTTTVKKSVAKKPSKKTTKVKKNPNGSYTLHMQDKLDWLHKEAEKRGMQTSVFVRGCIDEFINNHPIADVKQPAA